MGIDSMPVIGDSLKTLREISSLSEKFEKTNNSKETPDQISEHIGSILRSYGIRNILADNVISKKEISAALNLKLSVSEINYFVTGGAYLLRFHPQKFELMLQKETGMKDISKIVDLVSIELPDGRKKLLRHYMIEMYQQVELMKSDIASSQPENNKIDKQIGELKMDMNLSKIKPKIKTNTNIPAYQKLPNSNEGNG